MNELETLRARVESLEQVVAQLLANAPKPKSAGVTIEMLIASGMSREVANDFIIHRKHLKAPLTVSALDGIQREATKAQMPMNDVATMMMARGWRGFVAAWAPAQASQPAKEQDFLSKLRHSRGPDAIT